MRLFIENPEIKFVYCKSYFFDERRKFRNFSSSKDCTQKKLIQTLLLKNCIGSASVVMVDRICFEKVGFFDEGLVVAEDWDMWLRICRRFKFTSISKPLVKIRSRKGSQSYFGNKNLENELKFLNKVFSDASLRRKWFLRRNAYSYRYYSAAIAYRENGDKRQVRICILKSLYLFPLGFFNKSRLALLIYGFFGKWVFNKLRRIRKYFMRVKRYNNVFQII